MMKKILILCALLSALTLNTFAYSAFFTLSGEGETEDPVFKVRISAGISKTDIPTDTETDITTSYDADTAEQIPDESAADEETLLEETESESVLDDDTAEIPLDETAEQTEEETHSGVFGGEGTIVFDKAKLKITSVIPCAPDGITVEYGDAGGFYRFMFYSAEKIDSNIPLMDIEFQILSGEGTSSVIISEGRFSDGNYDTPSENVSFTVVYETAETKVTPSTLGPQDSSFPPETADVSESVSDTDGKDDDTVNDTALSTDRGDSTDADPPGSDSRSILPIVITVSAVLICAVVTAIMIIKKTKK